MVANLRTYLFVSLCLTSLSAVAGGGGQSVSLTLGKSDQSLDQVTGDLSGLGYGNLNLNGDERDSSLKLNYQRKFGSSLSANLGWVDLGGADTQLSGTLPAGTSNAAAAADIADSLPVRGRGVTADVRLHAAPTPKLDVSIGAGVFAFKDERKAVLGTSTATDKSSGGKPFVHIGVGLKLTPKVSAIAEWERYFLDEDVDRVGVGLSYSF